jgi:hypothetical protein
MSPTLDSCINALYEPGFIGSSSGLPPSVPIITTFIEARFAGSGSFQAAGQIPGSAQSIAATFGGAGSLSISATSGPP